MAGIPASLQKALLEWSLKQSDGFNPSTVEPMSNERREWLENALSEYFKDPADLMNALFAQITPEKTDDELLAILEELDPLVSINGLSEKLDTYDGFKKLFQCITKNHSNDVRFDASRLISDTIQGNPEAQEKCWRDGETLLKDFVLSDDPVDLRVAINVISPLIRNNVASFNSVKKSIDIDAFISKCLTIDRTKSKAEFLKEDIELTYKSNTIGIIHTK